MDRLFTAPLFKSVHQKECGFYLRRVMVEGGYFERFSLAEWGSGILRNAVANITSVVNYTNEHIISVGREIREKFTILLQRHHRVRHLTKRPVPFTKDGPMGEDVSGGSEPNSVIGHTKLLCHRRDGL